MNKDKVMAMIRKKSSKSGVSINTLLLLFFFEQFLNRIAKSPYKSDLVLKGGFLLSSMIGIETRTTMDMDMALRNHTLDESELRKIFEDLIGRACEEEIAFSLKSIEAIKISDEYPGYKVSLQGELDNIRQPFSVDIATGDPITPEALEYVYQSVFDTGDEIKLLSYNLETIIAEKLETVVSRKTDNSRSKDFYDLYIIFGLQADKIDVDNLKTAITNTFNYRGSAFTASGVITDLEDIRANEGFRNRWEMYCKRNDYVDEVEFDVMLDQIERKLKEWF